MARRLAIVTGAGDTLSAGAAPGTLMTPPDCQTNAGAPACVEPRRAAAGKKDADGSAAPAVREAGPAAPRSRHGTPAGGDSKPTNPSAIACRRCRSSKRKCALARRGGCGVVLAASSDLRGGRVKASPMGVHAPDPMSALRTRTVGVSALKRALDAERVIVGSGEARARGAAAASPARRVHQAEPLDGQATRTRSAACAWSRVPHERLGKDPGADDRCSADGASGHVRMPVTFCAPRGVDAACRM